MGVELGWTAERADVGFDGVSKGEMEFGEKGLDGID